MTNAAAAEPVQPSMLGEAPAATTGKRGARKPKETKSTQLAVANQGQPGGEVQVMERDHSAPATPQSGAVLVMIQQAASNPDVSVEKMAQLLEMYEKREAKDAKMAYFAALALAQAEFPVIGERGGIKNAKGEVQSKYAYWEDIISAINPILGKHGLSLSFRVSQNVNGAYIITAVLSHAAGHQEESTLILPLETSGSKNAVQAAGSTVSYGKRYTAGALLNFVSTGEDDDGQSAGNPGLITDIQKQTLVGLMQETGANTVDFLKFMKIDNLDMMKAKDYPRAETALIAKRARVQGEGAHK